jgi:hypothetical protein
MSAATHCFHRLITQGRACYRGAAPGKCELVSQLNERNTRALTSLIAAGKSAQEFRAEFNAGINARMFSRPPGALISRWSADHLYR